MTTSPHAIEVFFSYSHRDEALREELCKHLSSLQRHGVISGWHDRMIGPGTEWEGQIDEHLESARIILLLISADFMASDYCYDIEMKRAMQRHQAREAVVIPVILRDVDCTGAPFSRLQGLPKGFRPITSWENRDEAFTSVARGIRQVADRIRQELQGGPAPIPVAPSRREAVKVATAPKPALDPADVAQAARALAQYEGPIAEVLAARIAPKARSLQHLYELLAAEIKSDQDRRAFLGRMPGRR